LPFAGRPAKVSARSRLWAASTLIAKMRLPSIAFAAGLLRLTQARTNGGSADTEEIALTVMPLRPSGPSVVTTETAVAAPPMAALNCSGDMCCMSGLSCEEHASRDDKGKIDYMTYLDW